MPDVILAYQLSVCQTSCLFIKGTYLVLKIFELQPEHVQDITGGFTLGFIALVDTERFVQFCNYTLDFITVNTSHTLYDIVLYCRHQTEIPTSNRVVVLHCFLPLFPLEQDFRAYNHRLVLISNVTVTPGGAGNSFGRTVIIDFMSKNLSELKFKAITIPLNRSKQIIIVQHLTGPLNSPLYGWTSDIYFQWKAHLSHNNEELAWLDIWI